MTWIMQKEEIELKNKQDIYREQKNKIIHEFDDIKKQVKLDKKKKIIILVIMKCMRINHLLKFRLFYI